MFKKLKERIGGWTKKITKEKAPEEEFEEKPQDIVEDIPKKKSEIKKKKNKKQDKEELVELPQRFNVAQQNFEPNVEKIEETIEKVKKSKQKKSFFGKARISDEEFDKYSEELEMMLIENNVALEVTDKIIENLKERIVGEDIPKKELESMIFQTLKETIEDILIEPFDIIERIKEKKEKPHVILFCGINGTGKTTTIAKISEFLKKNKLSSVMAAADTFRAASIEQIKTHGEKTNTPVVAHEYGSDPASVGYDAIQYAKKNKIDVVLIDTAGRMHSAKNLLKELEKIHRVSKPDLTIFVGEAIAGNDSVEQVKAFNEHVDLDGIILSKADIDEKGGTALSLGYITNKPILFLGTGQEYKDLKKFDKKAFVKNLGFE